LTGLTVRNVPGKASPIRQMLSKLPGLPCQDERLGWPRPKTALWAYTFVVSWRVTPVRRSAWLVLGAAVGFALWSVGNVLEEIMRIAFGEWVFFVGASLAIILTGPAGVVTLTAPIRWRYSGLVLLGIVASLLLEDLPLLAPIPWIGLSYLLWSGTLEETATATSVPDRS
jgi:hypothetical protein